MRIMSQCRICQGLRQWFNQRWGWVVTLTSFWIMFFTLGTLYTYGIFFVELRKEFNSPRGKTAWIGSLAIGLCTTVGIIVIPMFAYVHNRVVLVVGLLICFLSCILTSFMNNIEAVFLTFGVMYGIGAGMLALSPVVYLLTESLGWRNVLRILGSSFLLLIPIAAPTFHKPSRQEDAGTSLQPVYKTPGEGAASSERDPEVFLPINNCHDQGYVKANNLHSETQRQVEREAGFLQRLKVMTYPEIWMMGVGLILSATVNTFYYVNMVDLLLTYGLTEYQGSIALTVIGISEVVGKFLLAGITDRLPFPKLFLYPIACITGIVVMCCFRFVRVSFSFYLSSVGESVDRTKSYDTALYACMGVYVLSAVTWIAVPVYQAIFAPDRLVMFTAQAQCNLSAKQKGFSRVQCKTPTEGVKNEEC
ncbi:monocarboxylate transporter 12-like [Diadema antillarum]|uniref:monocarboxylate transporter 12-like n=1 Tax=Diadema antillarum TaxID=105358 RepID=UPI003A8464CF